MSIEKEIRERSKKEALLAVLLDPAKLDRESARQSPWDWRRKARRWSSGKGT